MITAMVTLTLAFSCFHMHFADQSFRENKACATVETPIVETVIRDQQVYCSFLSCRKFDDDIVVVHMLECIWLR